MNYDFRCRDACQAGSSDAIAWLWRIAFLFVIHERWIY
jgi:hypothetical protein